MDREEQLLCVVAPCYNEKEVVCLFYEQLKAVLSSLPSLRHCILFVDDGSEDGTLETLNTIAQRDPCVRVLSLSRNFGHQTALTAGLDFAPGDAVVVMDSDLQHPPELIREMVRLWHEGYDVVSAVRERSAGTPLPKRMGSALFYWSINLLSETRIVPGAADFCLLSRKAHNALKALPEHHRFLRGMVSWVGFRRAFLPFDAPPRPAGESKYSWPRMLKLATNAIFSFSVAPIRLAVQLGLFAIFLSLIYFAYILYCYFFRGDLVSGWASTILVVIFFGGVQLAFVGLLGEYIARIYEEVKRRPNYLLKQEPAMEPLTRDEPPVARKDAKSQG